MKTEFKNKLEIYLKRKKTNANLITRENYQEFINEVKGIRNKWDKNFDDFKILAHYDILEVNGREKLIMPMDGVNSVRFYVATDELFGVLHTMHLLYNHADKEVMDREIKTKYCNVSKEIIKIYLTCCNVCKDKSKR